MSTNNAANGDAQDETTSGDEELPSSLELDDFEEGDRILVNYKSTRSDERQEIAGTVTNVAPLSLTVDGDEEFSDGTPKIYYVDEQEIELETRAGYSQRISAWHTGVGDPAVILQRDDEPIKRRFAEEFDAYETGKLFHDSEGQSCLVNDEDTVALLEADQVEDFDEIDLSTAVPVDSGLRPGRLTCDDRHGPAYTHAVEVDGMRGAFQTKYVESIEEITGREIGDFETSVWVPDDSNFGPDVGPVLLELEDTSEVFVIAPRTADTDNIVFDDEVSDE